MSHWPCDDGDGAWPAGFDALFRAALQGGPSGPPGLLCEMLAGHLCLPRVCYAILFRSWPLFIYFPAGSKFSARTLFRFRSVTIQFISFAFTVVILIAQAGFTSLFCCAYRESDLQILAEVHIWTYGLPQISNV